MKQGLASGMAYLFAHNFYPGPTWIPHESDDTSHCHRDPLDDVDIKHEYQLIIRKMSKLPASQRREVVRRWHMSQERTAPT